MPTVTRSRTGARQRREDVSARLVTATHELLMEGANFTELSMLQIAERAGVARSTLYLHFADKGELLIAVADQSTHGIFDPAVEWWRRDHSDGMLGVETTMGSILAPVRAQLPVLMAIGEASAYDPAVARYWSRRMGAFVAVISQRLSLEQANGTINQDLNPDVTARLLTHMTEGMLMQQVRAPGELSDADVVRDLGRAIWLVVYGHVT